MVQKIHNVVKEYLQRLQTSQNASCDHQAVVLAILRQPLPAGKRALVSSANESLPLRHTNTRWQHGNIPVADDSFAGGHLEPVIQQSNQ